MIWRDGRILADDRLDLPLADRIFEHGLGLFETFRVWGGRAALLGRHLARLRSSAQALGIDLQETPLPAGADVASLVGAAGLPDALVRLTVSAGRPPGLAPSAWMTAAPLPPDPPGRAWRVGDAPWPAVADPLAAHKTLNYWSRRLAHESARAAGLDEAILWSPDGLAREGSRTNLFVVRGPALITPRAGPLLPGIMRGLVLELADRAGLEPVEADLAAAAIAGADEAFLTNSVRGPIPVAGWLGREAYRPDPTFPRTARLQALVRHHLTREAPRS